MAMIVNVDETYGLSEDKVRDFKEAFDYFADEEGTYYEQTLATKNICQHLLDMGYEASQAELVQFRLACDATATGKYGFDGFLKYISKILKTGDMESILKEAFRIFDKDGTGTITTEVVANIMREADSTMTEDEIQAIIDEADADGSGEVDFDEFMEMMCG